MINPASVNISCKYSNPIDQEVCYNNAISKLVEVRANNLADIPYFQARVELQQKNIDLCQRDTRCASSSDLFRYVSLRDAEQATLTTIQNYVTASNDLIKKLEGDIALLQMTPAYKNAIASGQVPPKPVDTSIKTTTTGAPTESNLVRNIAIGVGIIVIIAVIVFITKRVKVTNGNK